MRYTKDYYIKKINDLLDNNDNLHLLTKKFNPYIFKFLGLNYDYSQTKTCMGVDKNRFLLSEYAWAYNSMLKDIKEG